MMNKEDRENKEALESWGTAAMVDHWKSGASTPGEASQCLKLWPGALLPRA
jgi:hypothetical protein